MKMIKIAPSILSANFARLADEIKEVEIGVADYIHVDVMDVQFVPNITIGPLIVEAIRPVTTLPDRKEAIETIKSALTLGV